MKKLVVSFLALLLMFSLVPELSFAAKNSEKAVVDANLNVRAYPSPGSAKVGTLRKGAVTYIHAVKPGGWAEIRYNGKPAYVAEQYLKRTTGTKNSRMTFTLKDSDDYLYKAYVVGSNEQKAYATLDGQYGFDFMWAGAYIGDLLYHGDYQIYLQKVGSSKIVNTGVRINDYTYNATRNMMYMLPSNYEGQPDLFAIANTESSNLESADLFYAHKGRLVQVKHTNQNIDWATTSYTTRPEPKGKFTFQTKDYYNVDGSWWTYTWSFKPNNAMFQLVDESKSYNY